MDEATTNDAPEVSEVTEEIVGDPKPTVNYFEQLAAIDVSNYIEKKNGYSYLSWAYGVDQLKRKHPTAKIIIKRFPDPDLGGIPVPYLKTSLGYFVEVEVVVNGVSVSEPFPVLDHRNKPISKPTPFDINNSIQRAKVKAIAGHGLGLYIYAGEDLPIEADENKEIQSPDNSQYHQGNQQYQEPPITLQQQQKIRELATHLASLSLGAGAAQDAIVHQIHQIYQQFQISKDMPVELANVKINELSSAINSIHDQRLAPQQKQDTPTAVLFDTPPGQLQNVI